MIDVSSNWLCWWLLTSLNALPSRWAVHLMLTSCLYVHYSSGKLLKAKHLLFSLCIYCGNQWSATFCHQGGVGKRQRQVGRTYSRTHTRLWNGGLKPLHPDLRDPTGPVGIRVENKHPLTLTIIPTSRECSSGCACFVNVSWVSPAGLSICDPHLGEQCPYWYHSSGEARSQSRIRLGMSSTVTLGHSEFPALSI
jgi:hypothetical protein